MPRYLVSYLVALSFLSIPPASVAAPAPELVEQLNRYRAEAPACAGQQKQGLQALQADERLAQLPVGNIRDLPAAVREAGFLTSGVEALVVSGPRNAEQALRAMTQAKCELLQTHRYSRVGAAREGNTWQLVLAEPLLDEALGDWESAGKSVLKEVNAARGQPRSCGKRSFDAAAALRWNARLAQAALAHSKDMAQQDHVSHAGSDGSSAGDRAKRANYAWRRIGENVAAGQGSARDVVQGWLDSPRHCANIMNPAFSEMGAAYVVRPEAKGAIFWTQVFGTPR
jgi:uncharacterized protein YkwD